MLPSDSQDPGDVNESALEGDGLATVAMCSAIVPCLSRANPRIACWGTPVWTALHGAVQHPVPLQSRAWDHACALSFAKVLR